MLKKNHNSMWDIIAWFVLIGILIWLILKAFGVINTPVLLEYAPFFGAVYLAGWAMHKLDRSTEDIKELKSEMKNTDKRIKDIELSTRDIQFDINAIKKVVF